MRIDRIRLNNFRGYGSSEIKFTKSQDKNVSIIAGKNGFGKTTFLTSLIWAMYGPLMREVEKKYKRDIQNHGGYENYLKESVNYTAVNKFDRKEVPDVEMSVEVELADVMIPSVPCDKVVIKRTYSLKINKENLSILIDGQESELTKEVGYDLFINDFILPREIAKFFFFDAEKIVSLAEAKTKSELRSLSRAYSEVLGIKKYEDLKYNLKTLLTKLKRNGVTGVNKEKLNELIRKEEELKKLIELKESKLQEIKQDIESDGSKIDLIEEKLIREGNSITMEELKEFKTLRTNLQKDLVEAKGQLKDVMDLVPLAVAEKQFKKLVDQLKKEAEAKKINANSDFVLNEVKSFSELLKKKLSKLPNFKNNQKEVEQAILEIEKERTKSANSTNTSILLDYSDEETRGIIATYQYVTTSFKQQFELIIKNERDIRQHIGRLNRKIKQAVSKKGNPIAQQLRTDKEELKSSIKVAEEKKEKLLQELGKLKAELTSNAKVLSEYEKKFNLIETDEKKYKATQNLLDKINTLTARIKEEKKYALEKAILLGLQRLMHKKDFISKVNILIDDDIMDIELIKSDGKVRDKDSMSKGEQQLYATALLKALVDESKIEFPIFIDSPLQKFDFEHSGNILEQFYPTISEQVVLFPLLEKELSEKEYTFLLPNVNNTFLIQNHQGISQIENVKPKELFKKFNLQSHDFAY
ncbi:AAA family ATPase [Marixanthomonas spongiae]|uniref:DNA sulfur modification protein DndD n=1 Tax=Marixanthomonas spongiae TaxID=2174845 RepID=A0A2U0I5N0_9FLAO|nr:AAA family ATPase [Marixanthomonas spongiae]PVW16413.1 DNA sulfur modification protein DndD [Marixanthomonas spongiae]